ncbi:MAG TPA: hypothetical protein VEJ20_04640 [Candidatus Eremiobacteraceae bacterium]|nr:hypothetical protein [Candidatus Eremiobacteraceae bacterium]
MQDPQATDETLPDSRPTIAAHLMGYLDARTADAITAALWKLADDDKQCIIVYCDHLRMSNFLDFRLVGESIRLLRTIGYDVRISVSHPRMRAVLSDLELEHAFVHGLVPVDAHVMLGDPKFAARRAS